MSTSYLPEYQYKTKSKVEAFYDMGGTQLNALPLMVITPTQPINAMFSVIFPKQILEPNCRGTCLLTSDLLQCHYTENIDWRLAPCNRPQSAGVSYPLTRGRKENRFLKECVLLYHLEYWMMDKSKNPVILGATHHHQKPLNLLKMLSYNRPLNITT
jgi:hypothetical protein